MCGLRPPPLATISTRMRGPRAAFALDGTRVFCPSGLPQRWRRCCLPERYSGIAGRPRDSYPDALLRRARAPGSGRRDDYLQPQPRAVEWREVQGQLWRVRQPGRSWRRFSGTRQAVAQAASAAPSSGELSCRTYVAAIADFADLPNIARKSGYKFAIDCMYGAGRHLIAELFSRHGIPFVEIARRLTPPSAASTPNRLSRMSAPCRTRWSAKNALRDWPPTATPTALARWMSMAIC
jgi:hypothetical protein